MFYYSFNKTPQGWLGACPRDPYSQSNDLLTSNNLIARYPVYHPFIEDNGFRPFAFIPRWGIDNVSGS